MNEDEFSEVLGFESEEHLSNADLILNNERLESHEQSYYTNSDVFENGKTSDIIIDEHFVLGNYVQCLLYICSN